MYKLIRLDTMKAIESYQLYGEAVKGATVHHNRIRTLTGKKVRFRIEEVK